MTLWEFTAIRQGFQDFNNPQDKAPDENEFLAMRESMGLDNEVHSKREARTVSADMESWLKANPHIKIEEV